MKNLSDGQWLLVLWGAIVAVLLLGLAMKITTMVVLALVGGAGAGYTTYLYVRQATDQGPRSGPPGDDAEPNEGTKP
jgi:hypothetical protein